MPGAAEGARIDPRSRKRAGRLPGEKHRPGPNIANAAGNAVIVAVIAAPAVIVAVTVALATERSPIQFQQAAPAMGPPFSGSS